VKTVRVRYLVVNSPNSYNIINERPAFNLLGAFLSTKFLVMKYPLDNGKVGTIKGNQKITRECYHNSLRLQKGKNKANNDESHTMNMIDLDPREKFQQAIINMRSPLNIKEVQQLTGRLAALSHFLSYAGDKAFSFFTSIKKKENFEWTTECEDAFQQIKAFLSSPTHLAPPQ
jgi:hypothetical protein